MKVFYFLVFLLFSSIHVLAQNSVFIEAEEALNNGDFESCVQYTSKYIKESVASDSKCVAYLYRGISYYNLQDWSKAEKDLVNSLNYKTIDDQIWAMKYKAYEMLGFTMYYKNDYKKALKYLLQAEKYTDILAPINTTLGYTEMILGNYDSALNYLNKAIQEDPEAAYAYSNLAFVKMKQGDLEGAMVSVNKSIEEDPANGWAYKHKAMIYIEMNEMENACEQLRIAQGNNYADFDKKQSKNEVVRLIKKHCK